MPISKPVRPDPALPADSVRRGGAKGEGKEGETAASVWRPGASTRPGGGGGGGDYPLIEQARGSAALPSIWESAADVRRYVCVTALGTGGWGAVLEPCLTGFQRRRLVVFDLITLG